MKAHADKQVQLTRRVAQRWLRSIAFPEHRLLVLCRPEREDRLHRLLQCVREGSPPRGLPPIRDLGVRRLLDGFEIWTHDVVQLKALCLWLEQRGFETSGM